MSINSSKRQNVEHIIIHIKNDQNIFYQKIVYRRHVGVFTEKANIWIFIQVNMSVTVDPQVLLEAPLFT